MEQERSPRRGSETRQRTAAVMVRLTPDECATLNTRAEAAGLSPAGFMRAAALGNAGPRARRQQPANVDVLRRLLGAVGSVGANCNQLSARANRGELPAVDELRAAAGDIRELRSGIMTALGRVPG